MRTLFLAAAMASHCASAQLPAERSVPTPADFAMQLPLTVSGNNGVVQLRLPQSVYTQAQSPALEDLRIFNNAGEVLPFAFFEPLPPARALSEVRYRESASRLFPVHAAVATAGTGDLQLEVRAAPDGSLLSISAERSGAAVAAEALSALIVDLGPSSDKETLDGLQLQPPTNASVYRATLAIERSDDLKLWDTVAHSNVDWLSGSQDARLVNDRIEIADSYGRYLRIRWLEGEARAFAAVTARWRSRADAVEAQIADPVYQLRLPAQAGRAPGDFVYRSSPAIAATEIGLELAEPNSVVPVSIGFYRELPGRKPAWMYQPQIQNTFYRLSIDSQERRSSRLAIAPLASAEWVVRAQLENSAQLRAPELVLRWKPRTLAFTARGSGFVLAFGADPVRANNYIGGPVTLERVAPGFNISELSALEAAVPGDPSVPPARASTAPIAAPVVSSESKIDQRKLLLWSVLILGVLVLAFMSWRLFRQIGEPKP